MRTLIFRNLSIATLGLLLAGHATAASVTFWYAGYVTTIYNPSNALPIAVSEGMPFTGRVTYDGALISNAYTNTVTGGNYGVFYPTNIAAFSSLFQIGGHVVTNKNSSPNSSVGEIFVSNNYQNWDALLFSVSESGNLQLDGAPLGNPNLVPARYSSLDVELADQTQAALNNPGLPVGAPDLSQFTRLRDLRWTLSLDDGKPTTLFAVNGTITAISTNELVFLTRTILANNTARLSWPALNNGFTLQVSTNVAAGNWQNATNAVTQNALEYSVSISTAGIPRFYRLKK